MIKQLAGDGHPGRVVRLKDIPSKYWKTKSSAWNCGTYIQDFVLYPIPRVHKSGGGIVLGMDKTHPNLCAWIPEEYFEEEETNEWGVVSL